MAARNGSLVSRLRRLKLKKVVEGVVSLAHTVSGAAISVAEKSERVAAAVQSGANTYRDPAAPLGGTNTLVMWGALALLVVVLLRRR